MTKENILSLIFEFYKETWKYDENDELDNLMEYIYSIEHEVKTKEDLDLKLIYDRLKALMGVIRFKCGFESIIINSNPIFEDLRRIIDEISLNNGDVINVYNYILTVYNNLIDKITNLSFINNNYDGVIGKEGLYLAVESLKSLITNKSYRNLLSSEQIREVLIDCIKLNNGITDIRIIETKYKEIISMIWKQSLTLPNDKGEFRVLFSNISGDSLSNQAESLINRQDQSSCSMISSKFIATYGSSTRRIGFIYPNDSEIIMASAYDLGSNVFGSGLTNSEKGTLLATPEVIERIGISRAKEKGEDVYSSTFYSEFLVKAKPSGIMVIGLGENDLNVDYQEAIELSRKMNLPIQFVDTMQYKSELSEIDKYYIAFHSILSFMGMTMDDFIHQEDNGIRIDKIIEMYKDQISEVFKTLKNSNNLNKENMLKSLDKIVDFSLIDEKEIG